MELKKRGWGQSDDLSFETIFSRSFSVLDRLSIIRFHFARDLRSKNGKYFSLEGNKRVTNFVCDFHAVRSTSKVSFSWRISEDDCKKVVSSVHFHM